MNTAIFAVITAVDYSYFVQDGTAEQFKFNSNVVKALVAKGASHKL